MVSADLHDQSQVHCNIKQKATNWRKRGFWRLCETAVLNSYVLYKILCVVKAGI